MEQFYQLTSSLFVQMSNYRHNIDGENSSKLIAVKLVNTLTNCISNFNISTDKISNKQFILIPIR